MITASFTSTSARMMPCSPISSRSQFRMSPSNSPSMRSVPLTINVPRKFEFTPITVFADGCSSGCGCWVRNLSTCTSVCGLQDAPGLEQPLEVVLAVELELHPAALAPGLDRDLRREPLLEPRLPLGESGQAAGTRPRVRGAL